MSSAADTPTTRADQRGNRERQHEGNRNDDCPRREQQVYDNDDRGERNDPLPAFADRETALHV